MPCSTMSASQPGRSSLVVIQQHKQRFGRCTSARVVRAQLQHILQRNHGPSISEHSLHIHDNTALVLQHIGVWDWSSHFSRIRKSVWCWLGVCCVFGTLDVQILHLSTVCHTLLKTRQGALQIPSRARNETHSRNVPSRTACSFKGFVVVVIQTWYLRLLPLYRTLQTACHILCKLAQKLLCLASWHSLTLIRGGPLAPVRDSLHT